MTIEYYWSHGVLIIGGCRFYFYKLEEAKKAYRKRYGLEHKHINFVEKRNLVGLISEYRKLGGAL